MKHRRYTHDEIHQALYDRVGGSAPPAEQVYGCPYFVRLKGILEPDWGACVNPESPGGECPFCGQRTNEWLKREKAEKS